MKENQIYSQSMGLQDEKKELLITPFIKKGQLPTFVEDALSVAPEGETRDMLLLSLLTNCAFALPAMRMYHGNPRHTYGPDMMSVVLAPAASGKGIMNIGRQLMQDLENVCGEPIYLPANTSSSALISNIRLFRGKAVIFAPEIDTMTQAMRSGFGGFSDIIRCLFEHETISQMRRQNDEFIEIEDPHVSILLSGTPNQMYPLLKSRENGLLSRFACYVVKTVQDFDDSVWDVHDKEGMQGQSVVYARLASELGARYRWMRAAKKKKCYFYLTDAQCKTVKRMFRSEYEVYSRELGQEFASTLKRMPVIMKRIGMILTTFRLDITKPLPERVECSEEDFETMLLIGHKLLMHAAMVYRMLPEVKKQNIGEIGVNMLQRQFFGMLPTDFTKQDAMKQAEVLGISVDTMKRWLTKYTQSGEIQRIEQGKYRKISS